MNFVLFQGSQGWILVATKFFQVSCHFSMIFITFVQIPWYFQVFQVYSHFSRFSRPSGNPAFFWGRGYVYHIHHGIGTGYLTPAPTPVLTSSGGHQNTYMWLASGQYASCWNAVFVTRAIAPHYKLFIRNFWEGYTKKWETKFVHLTVILTCVPVNSTFIQILIRLFY